MLRPQQQFMLRTAVKRAATSSVTSFLRFWWAVTMSVRICRTHTCFSISTQLQQAPLSAQQSCRAECGAAVRQASMPQASCGVDNATTLILALSTP